MNDKQKEIKDTLKVNLANSIESSIYRDSKIWKVSGFPAGEHCVSTISILIYYLARVIDCTNTEEVTEGFLESILKTLSEEVKTLGSKQGATKKEEKQNVST